VNTPLASIIIPSYNTPERYLRQAVDSALAQTYPAIEVIIVDDGSTDGSGAVADEIAAADARIRVIHQANRGPSAARNAGIRDARGAYISFLDADDWILPGKLSLQVAALEKRPDIDLVYSDYQKYDEDEDRVYDLVRGVPPIPFPELFVYRNWFTPIVTLLRRRLVELVGGFDEQLRASEDWDYWYRCTKFTEFLYVPGVVAVYRLHGTQSTLDDERMVNSYLQFAAKHFSGDRRRYRSNMTAFHLSRAKFYRSAGKYGLCALHLARYLASARSLREAKLVWDFPRI
jgi:glycosyltransferase involved in cell wall biosynthesis